VRHPSVSVAAPSSYGRASPTPMLCDEVRMRRAANTPLTRSSGHHGSPLGLSGLEEHAAL